MAHKILVVEDDDSARMGLLALLTDEGYETVTAASLPEAFAEIREEPPDLLLVDVRLAGDNGLQLVAMSPVPIPSIVMTGFADPMLEEEARRLGAQFVVKPIAPRALMALVAARLTEPAPARSRGESRPGQ